jgi:hypothetical protein
MKRASLFLSISALVAPLPAVAQDKVFVQVPAIISPSAIIPSAVKEKCGVDALLGDAALSAIGKRYPSVQAVTAPEQAGGGTFVQLTVVSVDALGGGAWSGEKSMTIKADIVKGGVVAGTTLLTRGSKGGAFAGFKGTCSILERVAGALGKDVASWMWRGPAAPAAKSDAD